MQIFKPRRRHLRRAQLHMGTGRRVEHPGWCTNDDARIALKQDQVAIGAPKRVVAFHWGAKIGVPTIVNHYRSSDMGRMERT